MRKKYPNAVDKNKVGEYSPYVKSGGGYFYDEVLEYRVWVHPEGEEVYYHAFSSYEEAKAFSESTAHAEEPLVLVYQEEYINEPKDGVFIHIKEPRITEWKPEWLEGSNGTKKNIPLFFKKR